MEAEVRVLVYASRLHDSVKLLAAIYSYLFYVIGTFLPNRVARVAGGATVAGHGPPFCIRSVFWVLYLGGAGGGERSTGTRRNAR